MRNSEIRDYIRDRKIYFWQVAECLGINDSSFSRMLWYEIPEEMKTRIKTITDKLAIEQEAVKI